MKYLVDTHVLIWAFTDPDLLPPRFRDILLDEGNEIFYSQFSLWEISLKYSLGKLSLEGRTPEQFYLELEASFFTCHPASNEELISFHKLPREHKDPFDRFLIWQCIVNGYAFLSVDADVPRYHKYGLKFEQA